MKILKKFMCTVLVVVLCLTSAPLQGFVGLELPEWNWKANAVNELAPTGKCGENVYWNFNSATGELVISGTGPMWDYRYHTFESKFCNTNVKSVIIDDGVTSIGDHSFENCAKLEKVILMNGITKLGEKAFFQCVNLKNINLPDSLMSMGLGIFQGCTSLKNVTIPNSITNIPKQAFYDCTNLVDLKIPENVISIESFAFQNCKSLKKITIPNSVTSIGYSAFLWCNSLDDVYINDINCWLEIDFEYDANPLACGDGILYLNNEKVTDLIIPRSITRIKNNTFVNCQTLKSVVIHEGVLDIGNDAFSLCNNITNVIIGDSVENIGNRAFYSCDGITNVVLGKNVINIGDESFYNCTNLVNITIPNGVTNIGYEAFEYCHNLTSVSIPESVTNIGERAFHRCFGLTSIIVDENNKNYLSIGDAVLFNKDKTVLIQSISTSDEWSYSIPSSVTTICDGAFFCCEFGEIILPNGLTNIGTHAFMSSDLRSITIPDKVTVIREQSFYSCLRLQSVTIGNSINTIEGGAFADCNIRDVYYHGSEEQWNNIIIEENNDELLNATIHFLGEEEPEYDSYRLQLRSDGRYSDSIAVGNTIGFYTYLSENGKLLDCERAYAISFDNPSVFEVIETEITEPSFDVTLKAKKVGTTNMTISDNITGAYVTIRLKANNPKEIITMDEVEDLAKEYQKDKLTNFYDYNGLYIDGYFYQEYSDGSYRAYMNAYNEKAYYGAVVSYDKNGNIVDHRLINPQDKLPTSIWSGVIDTIDIIDDHLKKFKDKYLYDEPTFTKHSDVDELEVPEGGYFVITNNYLENEYVFFANTIDIALDLMFAYSSTKKVDIPDSLSEKVVEKTIKDLLEEIGKDALKSIYKKMIKVFTKGITIDNVDAFMSTLVGVFKEYEIDFEGMIKEVVDDLNDTETKLDFAEDALLTILGAGTVKAVLSSLGYVNTAIKLIDIFSGSLSSEIIIYTPPEEEKTRTSNGVKVTSETPLDPDYVLHTYVINQNDDLMTDAVPTIDPLADNYNMYDITLYKSSQAVQPNAKIKVMIPIPAGYDKSRIAVYWYKEDGTLEKMNATVNGSYAIFETDHLSYYVLVEEHVHTYGEDGEICTDCGFDRTEGCGCNCHKTGIAGFFWKIINFFNKIFKLKQECKCGIKHY